MSQEIKKAIPTEGDVLEGEALQLILTNREEVLKIQPLLDDYENNKPNIFYPDQIILRWQGDVEITTERKSGPGRNIKQEYKLDQAYRVIFFPVIGGVACVLGGGVTFFFSQPVEQIEDIHARITARNEQLGFEYPRELLKQEPEEKIKLGRSTVFDIHSSQEWTAVLQACSDGKTEKHLTENEQAGSLRHQRPGAPFYVEGKILDNEREAGYGIEILKAASRELDIDAGLILLYVSRVLAPPLTLQPNTTAVSWIDLDDVARMALGGYAPNPRELARRREKVYKAILFGARWFVGGRRSIEYIEKQTGKKIDTDIYTSLWQITSKQEPVQGELFPHHAVPVRVELTASREWAQLTGQPDTAQFLAFGEVLGSIPGGQAAGAWARSLGMAYMIWARTNMAKALGGAEPPTRRYLLDQFPAKLAPYEKLLGTTHTKRIHEYFHGAEEFLKEREVVSLPGESDARPKGSQAWQAWLDSPPPWTLGRLLHEAVEEQKANLYISKPRQLNPAKRRGRPPKRANA